MAKAVLPIDGLAASINKSELCIPPSNLSKSINPVVTPLTSPPCLRAISILLILSTTLAFKVEKPDSALPSDAKLNSCCSAPSIRSIAFWSVLY